VCRLKLSGSPHDPILSQFFFKDIFPVIASILLIMVFVTQHLNGLGLIWLIGPSVSTFLRITLYSCHVGVRNAGAGR